MKRDTSAARAAAAAKRAGAGPAPAARKGGMSALVVWLVVLVVGLVAWGISRLAPAARLAGLVPWTGGGAWATRRGQWIDPSAADSLISIGEQLLADGTCSALPATLDVSLENGGKYREHKSHRTGRDVDIKAPAADDPCFAAVLKALMKAGWQVWYGGPGAENINPTHRDAVHITHAHARFSES